MNVEELVFGIDLGTTNSEIAVVLDGRPTLIPVENESPILPSVVGLSDDGALLVGRAAANQYVPYPERTVRSVKRSMGEDLTFQLGGSAYSPVEISAMILKRLKAAAEAYVGASIHRAVITVPAYFSDAQRTATKEAGEIAGFQVERILNEPTAASLCYLSAFDQDSSRLFLVYDLGGGTFDVSIIRSRGNLTEVLASHGDSRLGGEDFDALIVERLVEAFKEKNGFDPSQFTAAKARLMKAAEEAKIRLSTESYVRVVEEYLVTRDDTAYHLEAELSRHEYEEMIAPLIEKTKDSVQTALHEAGILARDLDEVILVGGATRTPMISDLLFQLTSLMPQSNVDPDLAVAVGAALHGARVADTRVGRILVDVTPFSFGTSYLGDLDGAPSIHCYKAIVRRNTPLPTRQTELFYTMTEGQEEIEVNIYQGEDPDARQNVLIGKFEVDGLDSEAPAGSPIVFDMRLDLNGILDVDVIEKHTGLKKSATIRDAFRKLSPEEILEKRKRLEDALPESTIDVTSGIEAPSPHALQDRPDKAPYAKWAFSPEGLSNEQKGLWSKSSALLEKALRMMSEVDPIDRKELREVCEALRAAMERKDFEEVKDQSDVLADILFYLE